MAAPTQNDSAFAELPLTHMERMELRQQELDAKTEQARIRAAAEVDQQQLRLKAQRSETRKYVGIAFAVALAVGSIVGGITYGTTRPNTVDTHREDQCLNTGGVWIDDSLLTAGNSQCFYPGRATNQVSK